jgi:peptidoglycan/LPS O-acetylase OafA/YrhL
MKAKPSPIDIESLDFLRGAAAFFVLINHVRGAFFAGGTKIVAQKGWSGLDFFDVISLSILQITSLSQEFVIMFFVISGFAMAHSMSSFSGTLQFYKKRVIRIWPPYLLAVIVGIAVCAIIIPYGGQLEQRCRDACTLLQILAVAFYLDGIPVAPQFWSLQHEVIFYALCPLLLANRRSVLIGVIVAAVLLVVGLASFGLTSPPTHNVLLNFLSIYLFYFMAGAALYHWHEFVPRADLRTFIAVVAALFGTAVAAKFRFGPSVPLDLLMIGATAFIIVNLPRHHMRITWLNLGTFSYSIYIFHYQVIALLSLALSKWLGKAPEIEGPFWWLLAVPLVLGACYLFYWVAERPSNAYLKQLRKSEISTRRAPDRIVQPSATF